MPIVRNIVLFLMTFGAGIFLFLPFFFLIPVQDTGNHVGPTVIQGNCSTPRNRCDIASQCEMQSSDTYSCSCPNWLTGSGFDDDPCICHYSFFPVPDFTREICVTRSSHLTLGWWVAFMYGTNACLLLGFFCLSSLRLEGSSDRNCHNDDNIAMSFVCSIFCLVLALCMIIPVALVGMGQPEPGSLCGGIKCSVGYTCIDNACVLADCSPGSHMDGGRCCPDHTHAVDGVCVAGDIGDCKSAATLAQCDRGAHCVQLDEKHFGCQCPNFMWDWYDDGSDVHHDKSNSYLHACNTNFSCAIEKGMVMGYADNPCRCRTFSRWGNQFVPDYERKVCVDKLLRLKFWDWITFNWLVGTADIFIIVYSIIFVCNCCCENSKAKTRVVCISIVVSICALFHGLVFGLGLGPAIKTSCGSSALDFKLCGANQRCVNNSCV